MTAEEIKNIKIKSQEERARIRGTFVAAPSNHCFACRKDVYLAFTIKQTKEKLIMGCPYCSEKFI
jgi:DNA-directed RNA polymerase subunit RPC12/RpoP